MITIPNPIKESKTRVVFSDGSSLQIPNERLEDYKNNSSGYAYIEPRREDPSWNINPNLF